MPNYDYTCSSCGHKEEIFEKITQAPLVECPSCHQNTFARGPGGGVGISLTGDGFYKTMYGKDSSEKGSPSSSGGGCCPCGKNKTDCKS